jgi:hypothetical protein
MTYSIYLRRMLLVTLSVLIAVSFAGTVHAESVVWHKTVSDRLWDMWTSGTSATNNSVWSMGGVQVQVTYRVKARNVTQGTIIACDGSGSAQEGDRIQFQFLPHTHTDISWFASGQSYDSPYGSWINNAARPYSNMCPHYESRDYVGAYSTNEGFGSGKFYSTLSVDPPKKTMENITGMTCGAADSLGGRTCTAGSGTSARAVFTIEPTYGYFYGRGTIKGGQCVTSNKPMETANAVGASYWVGEGPYKLVVPKKVIACPIKLTPKDTASASASGPSISASGASCTLGSSYTIEFTGTDPQNEDIRYEIDWDSANDSDSEKTADEFIPSSGSDYVASGSTQTASHIYPNLGQTSKVVSVRFRDRNGNASPWASVDFTCAPGIEASEEIVGLNGEDVGGFGGPSGLTNPEPDLAIDAGTVVRRDDPTRVKWSATRVTSCEVTGSNGDSWTGISDEATSTPIVGTTVYTLTCQSPSGERSKKAVVNIVPSVREI